MTRAPINNRQGRCEEPAEDGVLLALAERCEKATGPDRELDATISCLLRLEAVPSWAITWAAPWRPNADGTVTMMHTTGKDGPHFKAYAYTASLDAAMSLVPERCLHTARTLWEGGIIVGFASVSVYELGEIGGHARLYWMGEHQSNAATSALALAAASLRARAARAQSGAAS